MVPAVDVAITNANDVAVDVQFISGNVFVDRYPEVGPRRSCVTVIEEEHTTGLPVRIDKADTEIQSAGGITNRQTRIQ